jgi:AcrR family transcriptional regulator
MEDFSNNKKYLSILEVSRKLFWKHGIRRVSVDEICREAGTSKMTFYRFFPNKIELAKTVIDRFYDEGIIRFRNIIKEDLPFSEKMQKMIRMKVEGSNDISNEFIQDLLHGNNDELSKFFEQKLKFIYSELIKEFKKGQEIGWIRKDLNVEFMFYYFQKTAEIMADNETMAQFSSPQEMILEMANLMIYGIVPRE